MLFFYLVSFSTFANFNHFFIYFLQSKKKIFLHILLNYLLRILFLLFYCRLNKLMSYFFVFAILYNYFMLFDFTFVSQFNYYFFLKNYFGFLFYATSLGFDIFFLYLYLFFCPLIHNKMCKNEKAVRLFVFNIICMYCNPDSYSLFFKNFINVFAQL